MRATYRTGELDQRVTIRRKSTSQNDYGTLEETDTDLATVWALVRPMSGQERDRAQQTEARANYLVVLRTVVVDKHSLTEKDVVVWNGDEMNIRFLKNRGRSLYTEIECERGAP